MRITITACTLALAASVASITVARAQKGSVRESPHKRLERACEACHVPTSFRDIRFAHEETGFALEGPHAVARCLVCHNIEDFSKVDRACASCHSDVHRGRSGSDCERCHTAGGWHVFDSEEIHASTSFPVMGRHLVLDCESCHPGMPEADFRQTPSDCIACHQADYDAVGSPDHTQAGFSTDCRQCHQVTAWIPANMSDHDGFFPIFSGVHRNRWTQCVECHTSEGNYRVFDCLGCHRVEETDPAHAGMPGYAFESTACLSCHPTGASARYREHDTQFFPIYSGAHNGRWPDCASCHTTGNADFSCIECHVQADTDPRHAGMTDYTYTSAACFDCHPTGAAGRFTAHDAQFFPIYSGTHTGRWVDCASCHTTGGTNFSCIECHDHNQTDTDPTHVGMTGYAYTGTACFDCHPTGVAGRYTDHDAEFFPIYTDIHANRWASCATCHEVATDKSVFTCFNCHEHSQARMDDKHLGEVQGYAYNNAECLRCHPDGRKGN